MNASAEACCAHAAYQYNLVCCFVLSVHIGLIGVKYRSKIKPMGLQIINYFYMIIFTFISKKNSRSFIVSTTCEKLMQLFFQCGSTDLQLLITEAFLYPKTFVEQITYLKV